MNAVPVDVAVQICREVIEDNSRKWYTLRAMQCWGCMLFSENAADCLCVESPKGCAQVNERYARRVQNGASQTPPA